MTQKIPESGETWWLRNGTSEWPIYVLQTDHERDLVMYSFSRYGALANIMSLTRFLTAYQQDRCQP